MKGFKFNGNKALQAEELQKLLISKTGIPLNSSTVSNDREALQKAYADKGITLWLKEVVQDETGIVTYTVQEDPTTTTTKSEESGPTTIKGTVIRIPGSTTRFLHPRTYTNYLTGQQTGAPNSDKPAINQSFIHQRGYANYVTGGQPTLAGTPAPPRTVIGSTTIHTIEGQGPTVANSDRAVISRSFGHRRGYPGYISDGQTISAEKPGKTIAPPVILQTRTYVNESLVEAGNERQPSIARMTHYDKESGKPAPWPAVIGFQFRGNKALQSAELQKLLVSKTGQPLEEKNVRADAAAIQKAYADKGLAVEVQQASLDEVGKVTYILLENRVITSFKFSGNKILSDDELQKVLVQRRGDLFGMQGMMADRGAIDAAYSNKDVMLSVQNMTQDDSGVVFYTIQETQPPKITQIKISGLAKTNEDSVRKLISTPADGKFNSAQLRRDLSHIFNTNLFTDATFKVDDDPAKKGAVIVTFLLKEK